MPELTPVESRPNFYPAIARSAGRADVELCCAPAACVFDGFLDWLPKALSIFASASYPSLCASRRTGAAIRRALHQRKPHGHTTHHLPASNHWVAECNTFANTKYLAASPRSAYSFHRHVQTDTENGQSGRPQIHADASTAVHLDRSTSSVFVSSADMLRMRFAGTR